MGRSVLKYGDMKYELRDGGDGLERTPRRLLGRTYGSVSTGTTVDLFPAPTSQYVAMTKGDRRIQTENAMHRSQLYTHVVRAGHLVF